MRPQDKLKRDHQLHHISSDNHPRAEEKLTFVLTLASAGTGRDGADFKRVQLLLTSFDRFFDIRFLDRFIIVSPSTDRRYVEETVAPWAAEINFLLLDESVICPELNADPDTTNTWPSVNKGWFRQQLIKLAIHEYVETPYYMTLDSDVIFVRRFDAQSLIKNAKAGLNIQRKEDFLLLYRDETAAREEKIRQLRYVEAEQILGCQRKQKYLDRWYGETPVLLHRDLVESLASHIRTACGKPWRKALLDKLPWTEYPLYFLHAEELGVLNDYYRPGDANTILRLADSLWQPADEYRQPRDLNSWNPEAIFNSRAEGVAVVVQSYLGYPVEELAVKVRPFIN